MVKNKELKPPQELVDAINESEDMRAPDGTEPTGGIGTTRAIGNRLMNETPQKPSEMKDPDEEAARHGTPPDEFERRERRLEQVAMQQKAENYNRDHPGAGKAGRGDQAINSMVGVDRFARRNQGPKQT